MQLLIIDNAVSKDKKINAADLVFPVLLVDSRNNSIKIAQEDGTVTNVAYGDPELKLLKYAYRKRFGVTDPNTADDDVFALDSNLTKEEVEEHTKIDNPIEYNKKG